jgi:hypothetical protein
MDQKVVKGLLKFKNNGSTPAKKTTVELPPKELKKEEDLVSEGKGEIIPEDILKRAEKKEEEREFIGKTAA